MITQPVSICWKIPHVCPEKGSPIKTAFWEHFLTDAMPWARPGDWEENHCLSRSKIKAWNHTLLFFSWPVLRWPQRTLPVYYQHSTPLLGKQTRRGRFPANTQPSTTPVSWQQGWNGGPGSALSLWVQIGYTCNEFGGTAWIQYGSKFIHCLCELSSIFCPILHPDQQKGLKKQKITTDSPVLSACSWFLFLSNVIIKSRCRAGEEE